MRTATAITLVLLGGGATAMAVSTPRQCQDPNTGQPIACSGNNYHSGGHWFFHSTYYSSSSVSSPSSPSGSHTSSVSRGGFGSAGGSFHVGS